jgi:hypothetical protein
VIERQVTTTILEIYARNLHPLIAFVFLLNKAQTYLALNDWLDGLGENLPI